MWINENFMMFCFFIMLSSGFRECCTIFAQQIANYVRFSNFDIEKEMKKVKQSFKRYMLNLIVQNRLKSTVHERTRFVRTLLRN